MVEGNRERERVIRRCLGSSVTARGKEQQFGRVGNWGRGSTVID